MTRNQFYAVLATLLLVGCAQDEVIQTNESSVQIPIGFNTCVDRATRAVQDVNSDNLNIFNVWAAKARNVENSNTVEPIMQGAKIQKSGDQWVYANPDDKRYWIKGNAYFFNAFTCYPLSANNYQYTLPSSLGQNGDFLKYYQGNLVFYNDDSSAGSNGDTNTCGAKGETDLVWAFFKQNTISDDVSAPSYVGLTFNHLLSKVNLQFVNEFTEQEEEQLTISNVQITNAAKGTIDFSSISNTTPVSQIKWNSEGETTFNLPFNFGETSSNEQIVVHNSSVQTEYKYIIPSQQKITVRFSVVAPHMAGKGMLNIVVEVNPSLLIGNQNGFLPGYCYTLVAHLNKSSLGACGPIEFSLTNVVPFEEYSPSTASYNINFVNVAPYINTAKASDDDTSAETIVKVASLTPKELLYLGDQTFDPTDGYSYEWVLDPSNIKYADGSSVAASDPGDFSLEDISTTTSSRAFSDPKYSVNIPSITEISQLNVKVKFYLKSTVKYNLNKGIYVPLSLKIYNKNNELVGTGLTRVNIYYSASTTGGSQDGDDNDG